MLSDIFINQLTAHLGKPEYIHAKAIKEFMGSEAYTTQQVIGANVRPVPAITCCVV